MTVKDVYVGVGSNVEREVNIRRAIEDLREEFGHLRISTVYDTEPVGFRGDPFFNLVVGFQTERSPEEVVRSLHAIEYRHGRRRESPRFSARTIDLDLLLYGDLVRREGEVDVPREDVTKYAFVLRPLTELAGDTRHPVSGRRLGDLWHEFDKSNLGMRPVEIDL